jgi:transcription antitermination factor NusG
MQRIRHPSPLDPRRPLPLGLRFYALTTAPKREFHVAHWLEAQDWFSLVPLIYRQQGARKWHGARRNIKRNKVEFPLIPRIVVAGFGFDPAAHVLAEGCRYITGILGTAGVAVPMLAGEAERLRLTSEALMVPVSPFKPKDKVKVPLPGYGDYLAIVEIASIQGKWAKVIQSWFGTPREITVEVDKLEAA